MSQNQTAVAKRDIAQWLTSDAMKDQIRLALPKHMTPDRMVRVMLTAFTRIPKLLDCTRESLLKSLMTCSELGIEPDGRRAHLIPYENRKAGTVECQLIIDYKGLAELAMRSGLVSNIHADVVCEKDDFLYDRGYVEKHVINFREPRGTMYAAYAVCTFKDGTKASSVMSKSEVDAIRSRSKAGQSGPWVTDYNEMAKKTAFRRLAKWLPLSPEVRDAIENDDDGADGLKMADGFAEPRQPVAMPTVKPKPENPPANAAQPAIGPEPTPAAPDNNPPVDDDAVITMAGNGPAGPFKRLLEKYDLTAENWREAPADIRARIAQEIRANAD